MPPYDPYASMDVFGGAMVPTDDVVKVAGVLIAAENGVHVGPLFRGLVVLADKRRGGGQRTVGTIL